MKPPIDIIVTRNPVADANMSTVANVTGRLDGEFVLISEADGGFSLATVPLSMPAVDAAEALTSWVGHRIAFLSPLQPNPTAQMVIWEGLISEVRIEDGGQTVSRSLASTHNRVEVIYSTIDTSTTPPTLGASAKTAAADNASSQALYGIRHLVYGIGGATPTTAAQLRDVLLAQYGTPMATMGGVAVGGAVVGEPACRVTLSCTGFIETLDKRIYSQTGTTATATLDAILKAILTGVGQFVSADQSGIAANTATRSQYIDGDLTARQVIGALCALGDGTTGRRNYFGIYEQRRAEYVPEPTTVSYLVRKRDTSMVVMDAATGAEVPGYLVRPGRVVRMPDLLPDALSWGSGPNADPRQFVIGSAVYTSGGGLTLTPVVDDPSQTSLARMGLSAIG